MNYNSAFFSSKVPPNGDIPVKSLNEQIQKQKQTIIKIYTDWANHYLAKRYNELESSQSFRQTYQNSSFSTRRRLISSLATDLQDGILLVFIVESISDSTLDNVTKVPKTSKEMIENIEICIKFLAQLGVNVKEISAKDVHEGNLKSILTLFFNVSRYKQALRQSTPQCMPLNDLYGNKSTFGFPAPPPTPPQSSAPSSPSLAYTGFRSPPAVSTHPLMPYGRPFDLSGYVSDPGTQATVRLGLIPPPPPPSAGGLPSSPAALPPSREHVSPHCGVFPCSPGSSASSIVSLLSTASLPASTSNSNSNNISNASTTPSANMISRLPSSSSTGQAAFASSRLPSSGNPSTRLATSSSITGQLSTAANAACGFGGTTAGSSQKRISVPNKSNTSVPSSRSSSPGLGSPQAISSSLSLSSPSPYSATTANGTTTSPTSSQSSLPTSRLTKPVIPGLKAPQGSTVRDPRPNSTSSIPQVGGPFAANTASKPAVAQPRNSKAVATTGAAKSPSSTVKSPPGEAPSALGGTSIQFKAKQLPTSAQGQCVANVNKQQSSSAAKLQRLGPPTESFATAQSNGIASKYSTQLTSLKAQPSSRLGSLSSLKRVPATQPIKSDGTRIRPISTIIEGSSSSIPSMIMASSSISSCSMGNGSASGNHSPVLSTSLITKPTATVKAMVTPIMSTNQQSALKKRSPTETQKRIKSPIQQHQPSHFSVSEEPAKLSNGTSEKHSKSKKKSKEEIQLFSESKTLQKENHDRDSDSGSSQNSSDIENALANIEPMQPINLERPSMHNLMYLKAAQSNGSNGQSQMPSQQSAYSGEDYSDNSESQTQVKLIGQAASASDSECVRKSANPSRLTIPLSFGSSHLSDSTTLLNLHLRPGRANSFRLKNTKSQSEYGSNLFGYDETSSLSSDPGMVSGTDVSTGTTTSSSMCSSTDQRIFASKRPTYPNQTQSLPSKSKNGNSAKLAVFGVETRRPSSTSQTPKETNGEINVNGSRQNSLASSNGDLSSSSAATPTNGTPLKTSRPLSSPNSKNLVVHSGTLPLNGCSKTRSGSGSSRCLNKSQSKLRTAALANGTGSSEQIYSDSECVQQRSMMYRLAARGGTAQFSPNPVALPPSAPTPANMYADSNGSSHLYAKPKDGVSEFPQQCSNIYLNTAEMCKMSPSHHQPFMGRNAFTDTESVESLNLGSNSDLGQTQHLYGHLHGPPVQPPGHGNYSNFYPPAAQHLSKPGDLMYEYEHINRSLRETMSASPTMMTKQLNGMHCGVDGPTPSLNRNGSFRSTSSRNYAQFEPINVNGGDPSNRPPIPAHMNSHKSRQAPLKLEDQSGQSGSSLSLLSTSSSMFASPEEKYIHEICKLRRELELANEKILNLSTQLTANAHMVAAFEQSLSSMTTRLQQLSSSSEVKDCELDRLRKTIEILKQQGGSLVNGVKQAQQSSSSQFGRRKGSFTSDYTDVESPTSSKFQQRQLSTESVNSVSSCGEASKGKKKSKLKTLTGHNASWIRSSFNRAFKKNKAKGGDSTGNREFMSDAESGNEAGSRRPSSATGTVADNSRSVPSSPLLSVRSFKTSTSSSSDSKGASETNNNNNNSNKTDEGVQDLQKQLREKEMQLTDMRLESLTSTHQLENLKEMLSQMRLEMVTLKQDNDRLQRLVSHKSLASSASSLATSTNCQQMAPMLSAADPNNSSSSARNSNNLDTNSLESVEIDGMLSSPGSTCLDSLSGGPLKPVTLGSGSHTLARFGITAKTNWEALDGLVRKLFKEHLIRVDCHLSLGVTVDSLACYRVGAEQVQRNLQELALQPTPELLPFGYLVEDCHINLQFKSALDSLAFDTLTPKSILNQFLGLLTENRRLILAGPSGTGKTYLAHKLAEYLVIQKQLASVADETLSHFGPAMTSGAIATFNVDHKNAKELRAYLSNIAEQCESLSQMVGDCPRSPLISGHLPIVIILDNLHHIDDSLVVDIFNDLYRFSGEKSPYIIGTINQNVTSTQTISEMFHRFHFRMATFSVQTEPVKGFLTRYLRRKWLEAEAKYSKTATPDPHLNRIIDWIPRVSMYLNRFLENFFPSQNVSIGPRLFTSCPVDVNGSQIWFTDLWNFSILPFITENLRDLLSKSRSAQGSTTQQMYSRLKEKFIDPTDWVIENYPWVSGTGGMTAEWSDHLNRLRLEDILEHDSTEPSSASFRSGSSASGKFSVSGKPPVAVSINDRIDQVNDPFLEMLIKLKEATEVNNSSQELSK